MTSAVFVLFVVLFFGGMMALELRRIKRQHDRELKRIEEWRPMSPEALAELRKFDSPNQDHK